MTEQNYIEPVQVQMLPAPVTVTQAAFDELVRRIYRLSAEVDELQRKLLQVQGGVYQ